MKSKLDGQSQQSLCFYVYVFTENWLLNIGFEKYPDRGR